MMMMMMMMMLIMVNEGNSQVTNEINYGLRERKRRW